LQIQRRISTTLGAALGTTAVLRSGSVMMTPGWVLANLRSSRHW
jgi:hypothetical protein